MPSLTEAMAYHPSSDVYNSRVDCQPPQGPVQEIRAGYSCSDQISWHSETSKKEHT